MNSTQKSLEISYTSIDWAASKAANTSNWDPGFDAERCLVCTKIGPYRRLFEKPNKFTKRFFHTLYPLTIEHWQITEQLVLYDGFCTIDIELAIRFQATLEYIQKTNAELLEINSYIKSFYEDLVRDRVQDILLKLTDGSWVSTGLAAQEQDIELTINEIFLAQEIQAHTLCQLKPHFGAFPDIKFKEESVYLMAMKKNFELVSQKQQQQFLQQQLLEQQKLEQKQQSLDLLTRDQELELQIQVLRSDNEKKILLEKEMQQAEMLAIEKRLHAEKERHKTSLYQLSMIETINRQEQKEALERQLEIKTLDEKLAHQLIIKEQQLNANIKAFELEKSKWAMAKAKLQAEEIKMKQRQKQLEIDAELASDAYLLQQKRQLQKPV